MALDKVTTAVIADDAITSDQLGVGAIAGSDIAADVMEINPHIKPGTLYPAIGGKDVTGTALGGSYTYGSAHSDGRKYYYTDIKGSKPIKDPRIGGHFGSQRHTFRSRQLLEQETATHGSNVYSVDGREWCRMAGNNWSEVNTNSGLRYYSSTVGNFIEIVGYFSGANFLTFSAASNDIALAIDGTTDTATYTGGSAAIDSPLTGRYVNMSTCVNLAFSSAPTLGIHTLKIFVVSGDYIRIEGIELIAQDTTSTTTKSQIQIPSQSVVSYGKKFTVSGTPHYNPFDGMSGAKTLAQLGTYIDTATSLGMENWKGGTSNYYKPFNGGRVVKWVDSSGTIKTSVTMMPPNAQNISATASNAVSDAHIQAGTNDDTINFDTTTIANATPLSEVAKTYRWQEFGNGSANGGTGGTYADASMLTNSNDDIAYIMDDGLTSLSGDDVERGGSIYELAHHSNGDTIYLTFIGTGISLTGVANGTGSDEYNKFIDGVQILDGENARTNNVYFTETLAQNLSYGTHILKMHRVAADVYNEFYQEFTFHQPKKPPVPEDACILADYMLMADFIKTGTSGLDSISKGVRKISLTRDVFVDSSAALGANVEINTGFSYYMRAFTSGSAKVTTKLPAFASEVTWQGEMGTASINSSENSWGGNAITMAQASGGTGTSEIITYSSGTKPELGMNDFQHLTQSGGHRTNAMEIATPIHTSSHYQPFETPLLKELVGGDRNMEQNNLIVTPNGKSWDEVTRDTSYIGNMVLNISADHTTNISGTTVVVFDEIRGFGQSQEQLDHFYKDFAIAYDRQICLRDGQYVISYSTQTAASLDRITILVNGALLWNGYSNLTSNWSQLTGSISVKLKRGDYVQIKGGYYHSSNSAYSSYHIERA